MVCFCGIFTKQSNYGTIIVYRNVPVNRYVPGEGLKCTTFAKEVDSMKKLHRLLSAALVLLTLVSLLVVLPEDVSAASIKAPVVTASNDADTGKIVLTWPKVTGAAKYEIYRATSKTGTYSRRSTITKTTYTNTNAEAGKTYYYKVKAIKSGANSAYSTVDKIKAK